MAYTTAQLKAALLTVDGRMNEGGVVDIPPGARLLLDVISEGQAEGDFLNDLETAVAEAKAARDEARNIADIDTTDDAVDAALKLSGGKAATTLSATIAAAIDPVQDDLDAIPATIASEIAAITSPLASVADKLRAGTSATVALAGDSTGDETAEWWYRAWAMWAAEHGRYTVNYRGWDHATQAYVDSTIQTGARIARTAADTFTRTAADLVGTAAPRGGATWLGVAGAFAVNGSRAAWAASPGGFVSLPGTVTSTVRKVLTGTINVTGGTSAAFRRINLGMYKVGSNIERISLRLRIDATGTATFGVDGQFPTYSAVIADSAFTLPAGATELPFSLQIWDNAVTAKLGGTTITGTLTTGQRASTDTMGGIYMLPEGTLTGLTVDDLALDVYDTTAPPTLTVINGSRAGSDLTYQQTRLGAMFPGSIDALWVSSCHNYNATLPAAYLTAVESFLDAYRAAHPETAGFAVVAQNPEAAPASNRVAHRDRAVAIKAHAKTKRYALVDFLALFEANPSWPAKWIRTDGVHPTAASTYDELTDPDNGQFQMAVEAKAVFDAA